ncbi:acyltransferase [Pseudomonas sp. SWRI51]|uniref:acyltransferase family protein n=1 Tax=Pseudomonas sp. SWRI51 TaxID=2745491 RepID=UPI0016478B3E|nr:acyltransferase [Pseudomonas sp. SWRI51]MBC3410841.1 acyltransferase [Pseudomonas sp. SWRI51]
MSRISPEVSSQLDSIRALSALIVVVGHAYQILLLPTIKQGLTVVGFFTQMAVMVFFVLSGFLIGKSICNNSARNAGFNISQYGRDRALRLYPPLFAAIVLMVVLGALAPLFFASGSHAYLSIPGATFVRDEYTVAFNELLGALAFLNGFTTLTPLTNGPLWSLSIEAWYYVLAAAIVVWPTRRLLSVGLVVLTVLVTHKSRIFFMLAPVWFCGFALAFYHQRRPQMRNAFFAWGIIALSILTALIVWRSLSGDAWAKGGIADPLNHFRLVSGVWFACFLALLLGNAVRFPVWFSGHASYSYTLYVVHFPILLFALGVAQEMIYGSLWRSLLVASVAIAVSLLLAKGIAVYAENKRLLNAFLPFSSKSHSG